MLILYGSQTGTAEEFSHQLGEECINYGFKPEVIDMVDFYPDTLCNYPLVVIIVATYGDGEPTDTAVDFYNWIKKQSNPSLLKSVNYTVFGCGSTAYQSFQAMGRFFDKKLAELGAKKIFERGEGDSENDIEADFAVWKDKMLKYVSENFGRNSPSTKPP